LDVLCFPDAFQTNKARAACAAAHKDILASTLTYMQRGHTCTVETSNVDIHATHRHARHAFVHEMTRDTAADSARDTRERGEKASDSAYDTRERADPVRAVSDALGMRQADPVRALSDALAMRCADSVRALIPTLPKRAQGASEEEKMRRLAARARRGRRGTGRGQGRTREEMIVCSV
jgi:hypothetical protein